VAVRYLSLGEIVELHRLVVEQSGGASGMRDLGALESAVAQPRATYGSADLYLSLPEKAAALAYSLAITRHLVSTPSG
jgi:death on curing protein